MRDRSSPVPQQSPLAWREARHWSERRRLEGLIRQCFAAQHEARIHHFLPRLFGLWQTGQPLAAVGLKRADAGPLFQECYLEVPAEQRLGEAVGRAIARDGLAEIGNLASRRHGLQRRLFLHLIDQLAGEGLEWVVFTALPTVASGIRRLGIDLLALQPADPARLGDGRAAWGRYYEHAPWVMAGDLQLARQRLRAAGLLPVPQEMVHERLA
ncbi:thermostable hemolysin [Halomonas maura]|uniref:thermostable hemolysin n=1 Tax=Halomonas maura TaxID=117606 RepID=UPI0025B607A1|nr:thermostable hemolysin [Halomonas maura]MDN3555799.1 thermostable hemolysin [Halomonas maura]